MNTYNLELYVVLNINKPKNLFFIDRYATIEEEDIEDPIIILADSSFFIGDYLIIILFISLQYT